MSTTTAPPGRKRITARELANQILEGLAQEMAQHRKAEIAERMTALLGQPIKRQQVEKWLNPDPEKREIPNIGAGIALAIVAQQWNNWPLENTVSLVAFSVKTTKTKNKRTK